MSETKAATRPTTAKPTAAVAAPTPEALLVIPKLESHRDFAAASDNLRRLLDEQRHLENALSDNTERRVAAEKDKDRRATAILRGNDPLASPDLLRQRDELVRRQRDTERAIHLARGELAASCGTARDELSRPLLPAYRDHIRKTAFAMIESCRAYAAMETLHDRLHLAGLHGGVFDEPLPRTHPWGRPDDASSSLNLMLGALVDAGYLRADEEQLRDCKPQITPPAPPPVPPPVSTKKPTTWKQALRSLGVTGLGRDGVIRGEAKFAE